MQRSGNKSCNREAVSERDGEHIVSGSFDRADADKDQRECSDKFREQRTKLWPCADAIKLSSADNCGLHV